SSPSAVTPRTMSSSASGRRSSGSLTRPTASRTRSSREAVMSAALRGLLVLRARVELTERLSELLSQHLARDGVLLERLEREAQRDDLAGEVLGIGEVALGALAVVLERNAVAVVLPVLREQDERCRVRGLQRQ